jgi:hypothetical protein
MKKMILTILILIALISCGIAFPDGDWSSNPDILKIAIVDNDWMIGIFGYHNVPGGFWEVWMGYATPSWNGSKIVGSKYYRSNSDGLAIVSV